MKTNKTEWAGTQQGDVLSFQSPTFDSFADHFGFGTSADVNHISIFHELGTVHDVSVETREVFIPASSKATRLKVQSTVVPSPGNSAAYLATVRRRKAATLSKMLRDLEKVADRNDFAVSTSAIVDLVRELLETVRDGKREGNTRAILRHLRDSFMDNGWIRYRQLAARSGAIGVCDALAKSSEPDGDMVTQAFESLWNADLDPVALGGFFSGTDDSDGDQEIPD